MTKKREPFLIDLMDDTDSDSADAPKPNAWKRLRKGPPIQEPIDQVFDDPFPFGYVYESHDCDPFAFGGIDWCGTFTPDADEIRWQERICEEKLEEGAIAYFQDEEEERQILQMNLEESETTSKQDSIKNQAAESVSISCSSSSSSGANEIPNSTGKPRLWLTNPCRPYLFGQESQEIIDLTGSPNSNDDVFNGVCN